ncbi:MAG: hypothetical protein ACRCTJ_05460 [Brevinema sp.]
MYHLKTKKEKIAIRNHYRITKLIDKQYRFLFKIPKNHDIERFLDCLIDSKQSKEINARFFLDELFIGKNQKEFISYLSQDPSRIQSILWTLCYTFGFDIEIGEVYVL